MTLYRLFRLLSLLIAIPVFAGGGETPPYKVEGGTLFVPGNHPIALDQIKEIITAFQENKTITILDLSSNAIGVEGARLIAEALKTNTTLTTLILDDNAIGDEGVKIIAETLQKPSVINRMMKKNATQPYNTSLTTLRLRWTGITDKGVDALVSMMKTNTSLEVIDMRGNQSTAKGRDKILKALRERLKKKTMLSGFFLTGIMGEDAVAIVAAEQAPVSWGAPVLQKEDSRAEPISAAERERRTRNVDKRRVHW